MPGALPPVQCSAAINQVGAGVTPAAFASAARMEGEAALGRKAEMLSHYPLTGEIWKQLHPIPWVSRERPASQCVFQMDEMSNVSWNVTSSTSTGALSSTEGGKPSPTCHPSPPCGLSEPQYGGLALATPCSPSNAPPTPQQRSG